MLWDKVGLLVLADVSKSPMVLGIRGVYFQLHRKISHSIPLLEGVIPLSHYTNFLNPITERFCFKQSNSNTFILFDELSSTSVCKPQVSAVH